MKTCLIIDDSPFDRKLLMHCVERLGMDGQEFATPEDTLELCSKQLPDCILLDWELPENGAFELLKKIRAMPEGEDVAIIICTSNSEPRALCYAHRDGATDFIFKPVTFGRLQSKFQASGLLPRLDAVG